MRFRGELQVVECGRIHTSAYTDNGLVGVRVSPAVGYLHAVGHGVRERGAESEVIAQYLAALVGPFHRVRPHTALSVGHELRLRAFRALLGSETDGGAEVLRLTAEVVYEHRVGVFSLEAENSEAAHVAQTDIAPFARSYRLAAELLLCCREACELHRLFVAHIEAVERQSRGVGGFHGSDLAAHHCHLGCRSRAGSAREGYHLPAREVRCAVVEHSAFRLNRLERGDGCGCMFGGEGSRLYNAAVHAAEVAQYHISLVLIAGRERVYRYLPFTAGTQSHFPAQDGNIFHIRSFLINGPCNHIRLAAAVGLELHGGLRVCDAAYLRIALSHRGCGAVGRVFIRTNGTVCRLTCCAVEVGSDVIHRNGNAEAARRVELVDAGSYKGRFLIDGAGHVDGAAEVGEVVVVGLNAAHSSGIGREEGVVGEHTLHRIIRFLDAQSITLHLTLQNVVTQCGAAERSIDVNARRNSATRTAENNSVILNLLGLLDGVVVGHVEAVHRSACRACDADVVVVDTLTAGFRRIDVAEIDGRDVAARRGRGDGEHIVGAHHVAVGAIDIHAVEA